MHTKPHLHLLVRGLVLMVALALPGIAPLAAGAGTDPATPGACSYTAQAARIACGHDSDDDYYIALGKCANIAAAEQRSRCTRLAAARHAAGPAECAAQFEARDDLCDALGQAPYDPPVDPARFVDPAQIGSAVAPNPYFPLVPHSGWAYASNAGETNTVDVTGDTKVILGVTCAVVHDVVRVDGEVAEDTLDWLAQDVDGNVWYFGENSQQLEDGIVVSVEGSWMAGQNLARPGITFEAAPAAGDQYRQEFLLGDAEDVGAVVSTSASATVPAASCNGDCVLTADTTPLEPDIVEYKYYARNVGFILEVDPDTGERLALVSYHIGAP